MNKQDWVNEVQRLERAVAYYDDQIKNHCDYGKDYITPAATPTLANLLHERNLMQSDLTSARAIRDVCNR